MEPAPTLLPGADAGGPAASPASAFARMRLKVGDTMHVGLPSGLVKGRATVTVLGWLDNVCIIVTAPQDDAIRLLLKEGEPVLLRLFTGQNAFAFTSTVLKTVPAPFRHLHLSFPDKVESVAVRSSPRCRVQLPATVTTGSVGGLSATLLDIAASGALLETTAIPESDHRELRVAFAFELHGVPVSLDLAAQITGVRNKTVHDATKNQYGVRFTQLADSDRLMLGSLVCYLMLEHPRSVI